MLGSDIGVGRRSRLPLEQANSDSRRQLGGRSDLKTDHANDLVSGIQIHYSHALSSASGQSDAGKFSANYLAFS